MHRAGKVGQRQVGVLRAEADRKREMAGIGAAAHGEGLLVFAGDLVVGADQRLDGRAVGRDVEGHPAADVLQMGRAAADSGHGGGQPIRIGVGGEAAVKALAQRAVPQFDGAAHDGQRVKQAVVRRNAQGAAVGGGMQLLQHLQVGGLGGGADAAFQQAVYQQADGVDGALGHGRMAALAPAAQRHGAVAVVLHGHALAGAEGVRRRAHHAAGAVGHGVVGHAAGKVQDRAALKHRADDLAVEAALFAVADRELGVGGKAEGRHLKMLGIVVHVQHAGLLVGAQQRADGVAQGGAAVLQIFQRVQAQDAGAFVVGNAAAQQPAVPQADGVGVGVPAVALRHHVGVGDGGQKLLPPGDGAGLGPADVAAGVVGVQAQLGGDLQRFGQGVAGAGAEGRARFRFALHAGHGAQAGDIPQDIVTVLFGKGVDGRPAGIVHGSYLQRNVAAKDGPGLRPGRSIDKLFLQQIVEKEQQHVHRDLDGKLRHRRRQPARDDRHQHAAEQGLQHGDGGVQRCRAGMLGAAVEHEKVVEQVVDQRRQHPRRDGGGHDVDGVAQPGLEGDAQQLERRQVHHAGGHRRQRKPPKRLFGRGRLGGMIHRVSFILCRIVLAHGSFKR